MTVLLLLMVGVGFCLALWASWIEPRRVIVKRFEVVMPGLKYPLKAVVVGDIQPNSYHWPKERLQTLFGELQMEEEPDLVLWLGDYYNAPTDLSKELLEDKPKLGQWLASRLPEMDDIASAMSELRGRLGNFAILGNHDWAWSGEDTAIALKQAGIEVLMDDVVTIRDKKNDQSLQVVGYEDMSSGRIPNYSQLHRELTPDTPQIALSHSPDAFPLAHGGPALMLSGHTHGGQIRLPFLGALVLPIENPQYDMGWFSDRHRRLFVTAGLGTSLPPLRFLCPPEVVVLDLVPLQK